MPIRCIATAVYLNPIWAAYACEKFHGFEYPPGNRLIVKPDLTIRAQRTSTESSRNATPTHRVTKTPDILQLAETIAQASSLLQASGLSAELANSRLNLSGLLKENQSICNVKLPDPQPLASLNEETVARYNVIYFYIIQK